MKHASIAIGLALALAAAWWFASRQRTGGHEVSEPAQLPPMTSAYPVTLADAAGPGPITGPVAGTRPPRPTPSAAGDAAREIRSAAVAAPPGSDPAIAEADAAWEQVPFDASGLGTFRDLETHQHFGRALRSSPAMKVCSRAWTVPAGIDVVDMDIELRAQRDGDALVLRDAIVTKANVSDASLEDCLRRHYRGLRVELPQLPPGQELYRIPWGVRWDIAPQRP